MDRGSYLDYDGRPAVRFQRRYAHPVTRLWAAITDPEQLARWFPSAVSMQPRVDGMIHFTDDPNTEPRTGRVLEFDPPRRLAYTWGGDELHFHLEPDGDNGCILTMINVLESRDSAARNAAGWTVCLAELDKHLAGQLPDGPHSDSAEPWRPHYVAFVAAGLPSGAPIPG